MPDHSQAKVKLLKAYLINYLSVVTNVSHINQINIYDLFCGEGIYSDGNEGSSLIIMKTVKNLFYQTKNRVTTKNINCFFNDKEMLKTEKLSNYIKENNLHYSEIGTLNFSNIDYKNYIEDLKQTLKGAKSDEKFFIFIDPFGYKNIRLSDIKALLEFKNAEVLLWLPTQFMYRFAEKATPQSLYDFFDEINIKSENIENEEKFKTNIWRFLEDLKKAFEKYVGNDFFVDNFSIQKDKNTVFCLFFFTSHIKGFEKMIEAKWEIDEDNGKGWRYNDAQQDLFSTQETNEFEIKLIAFLTEKQRFNGEVYEFTLREGHLPKHSNQILNKLQNANKLQVIETKTKENARKNSYYLNYKYYKDDNDSKKVYFTLNP